MQVMDSKIGDLASNIATSSAQLKDATLIRDGEAADFAASEKELVEVIDTLGRAITLIGREMAKKNAAFTQLTSKDYSGLLRSLDALVDAASLSGTDKQRLTALVQSTQGTSDDDEEPGAPAAAVYESHSNSILDTLEDSIHAFIYLHTHLVFIRIYIYILIVKQNIGTNILMSQCVDHATTFPDTHSKISLDSYTFGSKAIVREDL